MNTPYFLSMISPEIIVMGALFLIFFALLVYTLSKVFRDKYGNVSTGIVGVISFCISVLIIYFGRDLIYQIISGLRLSNTILYIISTVIVLVLLYLFRKKLRFCIILMLGAAGLILLGIFTDWFYQKAFVIIVGIILLLLGIWLCSKKNLKFSRNKIPKSSKQGINWNGEETLIQEAKRFRKIAKKSKNPIFYGSWTHFIHYLYKRGYGKHERDICNNLRLSRGDFVRIFKNYGLVK